MSTAALLELSAVGLTLPSSSGPVVILKGADLTVFPGEQVAIVGPSGSGKSSLIAVAAGLEQPTSGSVRLFGEALNGLDEDNRARLRRGKRRRGSGECERRGVCGHRPRR